MEQRICKECGHKLLGRKDQKFCSDYCRNSFNNKLNEDANASVRKINAILRKNRRILEKLNPNGKTTLDSLRLADEGFNFHYFTNIFSTKTGKHYRFCYDYGYYEIENNKYVIVKKEDYVR
ncbi:MAG: hypothetical protein FJX84_04805 [Bacteroidetes bacterium]|nr:hypothetical protein [Bacteroidota bacterium]